MLGLKAQGQVSPQLVQQVEALKVFVLGLSAPLETWVFERVSLCARELGV